MDIRVILTIAEYAFRRVATGWFIKLIAAASVFMIFWMSQSSPEVQEDFLAGRALCLDFIGIVAVLMVTIMGSTEIPRDIETRTIMIILSKPVSKDEVVVGKYLGLIYSAAFNVFILGSVLAVTCMVVGNLDDDITKGVYIDVNFTQKLFFRFFSAVIIAGVVILLSTRLSEIPIITFTFVYSVAGLFICFVPELANMDGMPYSAKIALTGAYYFVPDFRLLQINPMDTATGVAKWGHFFSAVGYATCYSFVLVWLSIRSFRGRIVAG